MAQVNTVLGPVPVESLGKVLVHEHLVPGTCEVAHYRNGGSPGSPVEILVAELAGARAAGAGTVIDVTGNRQQHYGHLPAISHKTGLQIIVSTAFYKEPHLPALFHTKDADWIADFFTQQAHQGVEESGIRPGIIGEVGTSKAEMTPAEEKLLRAAARAHRRTGLPITTHCTIGTMGLEQLDLFASESVALDRVVIGHSDLNPDPEYHTAIARRGAFVGIDTIGKEEFRYTRFGTQSAPGYVEEEYYRIPDDRRIELVLELLHRGLIDRLLFSMDITAGEVGFNQGTFGRFGYSYLLQVFCQKLRERGVSEQELNQILIDNPARLLASQEVR